MPAVTSQEPSASGLSLSDLATAAVNRGDNVGAAGLAAEAAAAFLREQGEPNFDAPNMLRLRGQALLNVGDHIAAGATLDRAEKLAETLPPGEPFDRLRVHLTRQRGEVRLAAGDRPGARTALMSALELCEATSGPDDPDAAALHNLLGVVAKFTGNFDQAAEHYSRAAEIFRAEGASDSILGALHHNLGGLAHSRGDLMSAERQTRRALELHAGADGPSDPGTAADRGQLGGILSELGRHDEAERELRRAAADMSAAHGPNHLEVAIAQTSLGAALHRAGRLTEARAAYRDGLAARESYPGQGAPRTGAHVAQPLPAVRAAG